jgi:large exoprotein involved in heme utilization and adhesion
LGVDGRVEVEGLSNEASKGFAEVSNNLPDFTALIANGCEEYANSEFIVTGRGGLPPSPLQRLNPVNPIVEWAQPEEEEGKRQEARGNREDLAIPQFIEATGWVRRDDGTIELVANQGAVGSSWYRSPDCQSMEEKFGGDRSY